MKIVPHLSAPRIDWNSIGRSILREAAVAPGVVAVAIALVGAFYAPLTPDLQGLIDAAATALAGVVTALLVRDDRSLPAMVALLHAAFELCLGLGLQISTDRQAAVMAAVTALTTAWLRTQLYAKVGRPLPPIDEYGPPIPLPPAGTQLTTFTDVPLAFPVTQDTPLYQTQSFHKVSGADDPPDSGIEDTQALTLVHSSTRRPEYQNR